MTLRLLPVAILRLLAVAMASVLVVGACGSDDDTPSETIVDTETTGDSGDSGDTETTGDSGDTESPDPAQGGLSGTLIAGTTAEPASLDPIFETNLASTLVYMPMYDPLIEFAPDLGYTPQIAENYQVADDGMSITFSIREGVTFHSGRAVTADDVVYSFDRLRSEESINKGLYAFVDTIEAEGSTVTFTLNTAAPQALLAILAVAPSVIMDREVVEANGDLRRVDGGTGAFELAEWSSGSEIALTGYSEYWAAGLPKLEQLIFRFVPDEVSAAAALSAGEIDWFQFTDPLAASGIKSASSVTYTESDSLAYVYLAFNTGLAPFDDPAVRQAIGYGIDRQETVDIAIEGRGTVTSPITPAQVELAQPLETFPSYNYDPDKAIELLSEAGIDGLSITLTANSSNAVMMATAPVVVDQLARIGIDAEILPQESSVWLDSLLNQNYDMIFGTSGGYPNPDVPFYNSFTCEGSWNYSKICEPSFDEQVLAARAAIGAERVALYNEVETRFVNELSPYLYLYTADSIWGWSSDVDGFTPLPLNERRFAQVTISE